MRWMRTDAPNCQPCVPTGRLVFNKLKSRPGRVCSKGACEVSVPGVVPADIYPILYLLAFLHAAHCHLACLYPLRLAAVSQAVN